VGSGPSSPPVQFFSHRHFYNLSRSWFLGVCHRSYLLQVTCLFTVPCRISPPPLQRSGCQALFVMCLLLLLCAYYSVFFSFFPGWGSVCPGVYADLAQDCLWEYCMPLSSPCVLHLPKWSGCWHLGAAQEPSWFLRLM
jgi:hypothetical protein